MAEPGEGKPVGKADAEAALGVSKPDGSKRRSKLAVFSAKITGSELKNIERALLNPPKKVDGWASAIGLLSSGFFAVKTLVDTDGKPTGANLFAVILASVLFGGVLLDLFRRAKAKDPLHQAALADVQDLIRAQSPPDA